jgi:hypothetical protein
MLKKLIGVVAVTTMVLVASVAASSAQGPPNGPPGPPRGRPYPPPGLIIACERIPEFAPGRDIVCEAAGLRPSSTVTFTMYSEPVVLGTINANATGVARIEAKIPLDTVPGAHRIEATGTDANGNPVVLVFEFRVVPAQGPVAEPGSGALPRTGSSSSLPMAQIAVATIVAGGFLLIMANRRRAAVVPVTASPRPTKV